MGLQRNDVDGAIAEARKLAKQRGFVTGDYLRTLYLLQDDAGELLERLARETFMVKDAVTGEIRPVGSLGE